MTADRGNDGQKNLPPSFSSEEAQGGGPPRAPTLGRDFLTSRPRLRTINRGESVGVASDRGEAGAWEGQSDFFILGYEVVVERRPCSVRVTRCIAFCLSTSIVLCLPLRCDLRRLRVQIPCCAHHILAS